MRIFFKTLTAFLFIALVLQPVLSFAQKSAEELAKETEAACAATAAMKPTPEMIIEKVNQACALLQKEGKAAFSKFRGKDSPFLFAGTYIWIHDMDGVMRVHPIKYKMEDQMLIDLKDVNGKRFFSEMNTVAKDKGAGWVEYMWPKPGEKEPSIKVSYIKMCKVEGEDLVIGCGVYDMTVEEVSKTAK